MNNNFKYLIWVGTVVLALLGLFLLVQMKHVSKSSASTNTVSFSGEGRIVAKPDIAKMIVSVVTQARTSEAAQTDNSRKSQAVVSYLKEQGVEEKDIKTVGYNIYPQYRYPEFGGTPTITGYEVNESIEVKVHDLDKASAILDGVVRAGANQVSNFSFSIDNPETLKDQAREQAIEDAKEKADKLEDQLGIRLGGIVNFAESSNGYYPYPAYDTARPEAGGMGGAGPSLPTGENEIVVNITLTYQIK